MDGYSLKNYQNCSTIAPKMKPKSSEEASKKISTKYNEIMV